MLARSSLHINDLVELPPELGGLRMLHALSCHKNPRLAHVPKEVFDLTRLERLSLYENALEDLPAEVGQLTLLQVRVLGRCMQSIALCCASLVHAMPP